MSLPLTLLGRAFDGFERAVAAHAAAWPTGGSDAAARRSRTSSSTRSGSRWLTVTRTAEPAP